MRISSTTPGKRLPEESFVLLDARVSMPKMRPPLVERQNLIDQLELSRETPLVLITAPPGYGKTTLISQWASRDTRPFAYVHLDEIDNDPVVLLGYILLALEKTSGLETSVRDALQVSEPRIGRFVLPRIANDMATTEPFVLVLDNVHVIRNRNSLGIIEYLSENMPLESQLVLCGRTDPEIPLASHRVARSLHEIRSDGLVFDSDDAQVLFQSLQVDLDSGSVHRLVEQTEGWPAGLYLAALYLSDCDEPAKYINRFRGDHRHVADYFMTEVLARQPDEIVEFLRQSAILERLSGPLCDAVLDRTGSASLLVTMESTIPFLVPLDERREWYRYHHLFADLLICELYSREPNSIRELHARAAQWYQSQGFRERSEADVVSSPSGNERITPAYLQSALRHLQAAGKWEHAADLVATYWRPFAATGRLTTLARWLDDFSDEQIANRPTLALAAAWTAYLRRDEVRAIHWLDSARAIANEGDCEFAEYRSSLALLSAGIASGGMTTLRACVDEAYRLETATPTMWFALSRMGAGLLMLLDGKVDEAREVLWGASQVEKQHLDTCMLTLSVLALCDIDAGDWQEAGEHARAAYRIALDASLVDYLPSALTQGVLARVLAHEGEREQAKNAIAMALSLVERGSPQWWHASLALLVVVEAQLEIGDFEGAERSVVAARAVVNSRADTGPLGDRLARVQTDVGLRLMREPLSPSELHVLEQLPSDQSLSQIAQSIYLSRNTVKTHVRSIYRKLGVCSREQAVDLGRAIGLLS